jgi:hypothetical protein
MNEEHRQLPDADWRVGMFGKSLGLVVFGSICIVGIFATVVVLRTKRRRQLRQIALARQRALQASANANNVFDWQNGSSPTTNSSIRQRKTHIEAYLVTKPALAHDYVCDCARGVEGAKKEGTRAFGGGGSGILLKNYLVKQATGRPASDEKDLEDGNSAYNNESDQENEEGCTICFESFVPYDLVSWSPNPGTFWRMQVLRACHIYHRSYRKWLTSVASSPACCKRVFHHACLKEWLLRNKHCPWCREIVLPVDGYSEVKTTKRQIQDLLIAQQQRATPSFYCCAHGTVRPKKSVCLSASSGATRSSSSGNAAAANLIIERSTYLCSRDEIQKYNLLPLDTVNATCDEPIIDPTPMTAAEGTAPSGDAEQPQWENTAAAAITATTTATSAIHSNEGASRRNDDDCCRPLDDLAVEIGDDEHGCKETKVSPMDKKEDQHVASKVEEEEEDDDTGDESSLTSSSNGSSALSLVPSTDSLLKSVE